MRYLRVMIHVVVECILHPIESADLYFDEKGNLVGRSKC